MLISQKNNSVWSNPHPALDGVSLGNTDNCQKPWGKKNGKHSIYSPVHEPMDFTIRPSCTADGCSVCLTSPKHKRPVFQMARVVQEFLSAIASNSLSYLSLCREITPQSLTLQGNSRCQAACLARCTRLIASKPVSEGGQFGIEQFLRWVS
jgi:hypothetical protein